MANILGKENGASSEKTEMKKPLLPQKNINKKVVILSTLVAILGSLGFGFCMAYSTLVQSAITKDLDLSIAEYRLFGYVLTLGSMIGGFTSGLIADCFGRIWAMGIASVCSIIGWIAISFSEGALLLDIGIFLSGFGIGILAYVIPIYVAEIAPKDLRGGLSTLNQLTIVSGGSVAFFAETVLTWRLLALTGVILCLIQLVGLFFIPESPRWLAKAGNEELFNNALKRFYGDHDEFFHEATEIRQTLGQQGEASRLDLFQRRYKRSVVIVVGLMMFQQFGGKTGVDFYKSEVFTSAGFTPAKSGIIVCVCMQIAMIAVGAWLVDKYGRKPLLLCSSIGTCLGCFLVATSFFWKEHNMLQDWIPSSVICGMVIFLGSFAIGMASVPWILLAELFPANVNGTAGSLVSLVHWSGAWAVSYTFDFLMNWSPSGTFIIYSVVCVVSAFFVAMVVKETKGETLEEIHRNSNPIQ